MNNFMTFNHTHTTWISNYFEQELQKDLPIKRVKCLKQLPSRTKRLKLQCRTETNLGWGTLGRARIPRTCAELAFWWKCGLGLRILGSNPALLLLTGENTEARAQLCCQVLSPPSSVCGPATPQGVLFQGHGQKLVVDELLWAGGLMKGGGFCVYFPR